MSKGSWEDLPDIEPAKVATAVSWEDLPDIELTKVDVAKGHNFWTPDENERAAIRKEVEAEIPGAQKKIRSALNGATYGLAPKIVGAFESDEESAKTDAQYKQAVKDEPMMNVIGVAGAPVPGVGPLKGIAKYLALSGIGAVTNGVQGYNQSESTNTIDKLKDSIIPAAIGAVASPVVQGVGDLFSKFAGKLTGKATSIFNKEAAKDLEKLMGSAKGKYAQSVQDSNRQLINLKEAVANPNVDEVLKADIQAFLKSPEGVALAEQVARNTLEGAPSKLGNMAELKDALAQTPALAAKFTADKFEKGAIKSVIAPRFLKYGLGMLGAGVGTIAGGELTDSKWGATAGGVIGAALGKPGTALANMFRNPVLQASALRTLATALEAGGASLAFLGETGAKLAAIPSTEERMAVAEALASTPEGQADIKKGLEAAQGKDKKPFERFQ